MRIPKFKKKPRITFKNKKFIKEYVLGDDPGNSAQAVRKSYNISNPKGTMAGVLGHRLLNKPHIRAEIDRLAEEHGITLDRVFQKINDGLDANVVVEYKGEVKESDVPDKDIRFKYLQETNKILGVYAPERTENLNFNIDKEVESLSEKEVLKLLNELTEDAKRVIIASNSKESEEGQSQV